MIRIVGRNVSLQTISFSSLDERSLESHSLTCKTRPAVCSGHLHDRSTHARERYPKQFATEPVRHMFRHTVLHLYFTIVCAICLDSLNVSIRSIRNAFKQKKTSIFQHGNQLWCQNILHQFRRLIMQNQSFEAIEPGKMSYHFSKIQDSVLYFSKSSGHCPIHFQFKLKPCHKIQNYESPKMERN